MDAGGGGAGAYRTGSIPVSGAVNYTVTIGSGGRALDYSHYWTWRKLHQRKMKDQMDNSSLAGGVTTWGPITAYGGGKGGSSSPSYDGQPSGGGDGGSGGGGSGGAGGGTGSGGQSGDAFPGNRSITWNGWW